MPRNPQRKQRKNLPWTQTFATLDMEQQQQQANNNGGGQDVDALAAAGNDLELSSIATVHHKREFTDFRERGFKVNPVVHTSGDENAHDHLEAQQQQGEEEGGEGGGINSRTVEFTKRVRIVQWILALVGVSFEGSPRGVYALQAFAVLCQLGELAWIGESAYAYALDYGSRTVVEDNLSVSILHTLSMVVPLAFLHFVTRSEKHSAAFLAAVQTVTLK